MAMRKGKCTNFGNCKKADTREEILVSVGLDFVCPECASPLTEIGNKDGSKLPVIPLIIAGLVILLGIGGFFGWKFFMSKPQKQTNPQALTQTNQPAQQPVAPPPPPPPPPKPTKEVILTLSGSNTIGAKLAPELAKAYLKKEFLVNDIKTEQGKEPVEVSIIGSKTSENKEYAIEIRAHGSTTAFTALEERKADIGMASRRIKNDEVIKLSSLGDMKSFSNEHILGLDGIAIIVNPSNPIEKLSVEQIRDIYSGKITDWSQAGGLKSPVTIYRRDDKSGTYDTFKHLVMDKDKVSPNALAFEDSKELSAKVTNDPTAIGFIGLPYILNNKVVKVYKAKSIALKPNKLTVKTEDYLLSRRLYLYTPTSSSNQNIRKFIELALSKEGQDIVENSGLIGQTAEPIKPDLTLITKENIQPKSEYSRITQNAQQIPFNIRFNSGSFELDNKARRDVGRLVALMTKSEYANKKIILIGFADNVGSSHTNIKLSKDRAESVKKDFTEEGINIYATYGLGQEFPVDSNDTEDGREKNRRVEIWLQD